MPTRSLTILMIFFVLFSLQTSSCNHQTNEEWVEWGGPDKPTNLVVFFNKDTTSDEVQEFNKSILNMDKNPLAFRFRVLKDGYKGAGVNFSVDATPEQREQLKKNVQESPIVYKVFENVVPSDVKLEYVCPN